MTWSGGGGGGAKGRDLPRMSECGWCHWWHWCWLVGTKEGPCSLNVRMPKPKVPQQTSEHISSSHSVTFLPSFINFSISSIFIVLAMHSSHGQSGRERCCAIIKAAQGLPGEQPGSFTRDAQRISTEGYPPQKWMILCPRMNISSGRISFSIAPHTR